MTTIERTCQLILDRLRDHHQDGEDEREAELLELVDELTAAGLWQPAGITPELE